MTESSTVSRPSIDSKIPSYRTLHALLGVQTLVVVLVSINRLSSWTQGYVAPNEFLRWVDLNNMVLALISLIGFYVLLKHLEYPSPVRDGAAHRGLGVTFIIGAYLLAASYGNHEVTNYLHVRFCPDGTVSKLCEVVIFNDDDFSHMMFFAGFTIVNVVTMVVQVLFPYRAVPTAADTVLVVDNGLVIGAGIFANLAFERIGLDLYVVAIIAALSVALLWRHPRQPILRYYAVAYVVGLAATAVAKLT